MMKKILFVAVSLFIAFSITTYSHAAKPEEGMKKEDKALAKEQRKEEKQQSKKDKDELKSTGLDKQYEKKSEQEQKELGKGSEQGQTQREEVRKKWWKFWE